MTRWSIDRIKDLSEHHPEVGIYIVYHKKIPGGEYIVPRNAPEQVKEFIKSKFGIIEEVQAYLIHEPFEEA